MSGKEGKDTAGGAMEWIRNRTQKYYKAVKVEKFNKAFDTEETQATIQSFVRIFIGVYNFNFFLRSIRDQNDTDFFHSCFFFQFFSCLIIFQFVSTHSDAILYLSLTYHHVIDTLLIYFDPLIVCIYLYRSHFFVFF